ncbi:MAG: RNA 2',3'-cyclic phosphodiesterase [Geminicoccaceae bacterium]
MPRLFVALELPEWLRERLSILQQGLPDVRWVPPEQMHITLRFIGEVDRPTFHETMYALANVGTRPFDLELKGLGHFPPRGPLRQLWVGVVAHPELLHLKRRIDRALRDIGVEAEGRKFSPHVTLGRFRLPPPENRLASFLRRHGLFAAPAFPVSDFHLVSSALHPDGAIHEIEASYELVPGAEECS